MSTEATQNQGADVLDLEGMFEALDGDADAANANAQQNNGGADTQGQNQQQDEELDDKGNPVKATPNADELDLDLGLDPNDPANQQQDEVELVIPDDHIIKMTVDGVEVEKPYGELVANAQKYEAANKRFEEAAAIRKEYTEKAQQLPIREQQLGQVLEFYIKASNEYMQSAQPDWEKLISENPQQYLVERHNWELRQRQLSEARQVQANLAAQQARDQAASLEQKAQTARQELIKAIPEFSDPQKLAAGAQQIDQYLAKAGISVEMRSAIDTAPVLVIARKAMLYDQALAKQKQARMAGGSRGNGNTQQQQAQPQNQQRRPAGRVERPGAARSVAQNAASRQNIDRANADKRFEANPSVDTAAYLFE
jgi:hypothetical protein